MTLRTGLTLSHYRLVEKVGEGGMGVVWKAEDTVLSRTVAIKFLPADVGRDEKRRQMFLDEARAASAVGDAHIVQVHEFGQEGDLDFIVMEYVDGEPLSQLIHGRPMPPEKVARIGLQVARALAKAHRKGLLHRDLKPANILVTSDGDVKVVDFGLSALFTRRETTLATDVRADATTQTQERVIAGTLAYMSPEQTLGEKLDSRSDIFALGVVLYEMTTGRRPFTGATGAEIAAGIQRARPRPVHELVPKVPLDLDRSVQKALAARPGERYQTMDDLAVDLNRLGRDLESGSSPSYEEINGPLTPGRRRWAWVIGLVGALSLAAVGTLAWLAASGTLAWWGSKADAHTILITPMEVRGQTEGAEYVGRAFAEAIAVNLSRAKGLSVLPVPEAEELETRGSQPRARAAAGAGAGRLLTGALTRDGSILRASLSLVDTARNRVVWGTHKDMADGSLPSLAAILAAEVAAELGVAAPRQYEWIGYDQGTPAMAASPHFIEALAAFRRLDNSALEPTRALVEAFPNEPQARVLRALALQISAWEYQASSPLRDEVEAGLAALDRVDPNSPWDDFFRAQILLRDGRSQDSLDRFTQLLARDDLTPAARAGILAMRGQPYSALMRDDAALADFQEALRLDPANDLIFAIFGDTLMRMGRREEGLIQVRHALALNPVSAQNQVLLGWHLYGLGRWGESVEPLRTGCESKPAQTWCATHALALLRSGRVQEARAAAGKAASLPETSNGAYMLACYNAVTGDRTSALRLLRRSLDLGYITSRRDIEDLRADRDFETLRGTKEFKALVEEAERRLPKD